jgi:DNA-binding NtrC family response regulator
MNKPKILVLEDEQDIADIIVDTLQDVAEEVVHVSSSAEGQTKINSGGHFDLVISDIKMPGETGMQFIAWLRAKGIHTPVIFQTAFADKHFMIDAIRLGACDFLSKPYDADQLRETVDRVLFIEEGRKDAASKAGNEKDLQAHNRIIGIAQASAVKKAK